MKRSVEKLDLAMLACARLILTTRRPDDGHSRNHCSRGSKAIRVLISIPTVRSNSRNSASSVTCKWHLAVPAQSRRARQGERVEAEWNEKWYRAEIIESSGDRCKVHYVGYGNEWDEWVTADRIRDFRPDRLAEGTWIEVKWPKDQKWYKAKVLRSWYGLAFVHYEGFASEWDEWVNPDLIRMVDPRSE